MFLCSFFFPSLILAKLFFLLLLFLLTFILTIFISFHFVQILMMIHIYLCIHTYFFIALDLVLFSIKMYGDIEKKNFIALCLSLHSVACSSFCAMLTHVACLYSYRRTERVKKYLPYGVIFFSPVT